MATLIESATLATGERMDKAEFLRRWEALPELKRAELIEGSYSCHRQSASIMVKETAEWTCFSGITRP